MAKQSQRRRTARNLTINNALAAKAADVGRGVGLDNLSRVIDAALVEWIQKHQASSRLLDPAAANGVTTSNSDLHDRSNHDMLSEEQ
jgi:hypothetical protein